MRFTVIAHCPEQPQNTRCPARGLILTTAQPSVGERYLRDLFMVVDHERRGCTHYSVKTPGTIPGSSSRNSSWSFHRIARKHLAAGLPMPQCMPSRHHIQFCRFFNRSQPRCGPARKTGTLLRPNRPPHSTKATSECLSAGEVGMMLVRLACG